jgi:predicted secreted Zn-dependent protease
MPASPWIKSSFSYANSNCVEVRTLPDGHIQVRNSRFPDQQLPPFTQNEWEAFLAGVHAGESEPKDPDIAFRACLA